MNRTIKEAPVKRFHYDDYDQLQTYLEGFVAAEANLPVMTIMLSHASTHLWCANASQLTYLQYTVN